MTAAFEDYITFDAIAAERQVSVRTVRRWCYATVPGLAVTKCGREPLVHRDDLAEWLQARRTIRNSPPHSRRNR